jgi:hypothetical protein
MAGDLDSFDVGTIEGSSGIHGLGEANRDQGKKGSHQRDRQPKNPRDYLQTIVKATEASNEKLVKLKLPYRFCVFAEGSDIFIDLVVLGKDGKIVSEKIKNISHQDFARLIEDVSQIEGLFLDKTA